MRAFLQAQAFEPGRVPVPAPSQNDLYLSSRRSGRHGPPDVLQSRLGGDHVPRRRVPAGTGNRMNGLRPGRIQPVHYVLESNGTLGKKGGISCQVSKRALVLTCLFRHHPVKEESLSPRYIALLLMRHSKYTLLQ